MKGELKSKDTWESKLTQAGKEAKTDEEKAELKSQAWAELVGTGKIGYFALLRNLRNIFEQADETTRAQALVLLQDEKRIRKSLVDMAAILGPNRQAVIGRELTKKFEESLRGTLGSLSKSLEQRRLKGEITVVVEGSGHA